MRTRDWIVTALYVLYVSYSDTTRLPEDRPCSTMNLYYKFYRLHFSFILYYYLKELAFTLRAREGRCNDNWVLLFAEALCLFALSDLKKARRIHGRYCDAVKLLSSAFDTRVMADRYIYFTPW